MKPYVVGFDLGGTYLKGAVLNKNQEVMDTFFCPDEEGKTIRDMDQFDWKKLMNRHLSFLRKTYGDMPNAIGVCSAGIPLRDHSVIGHMPQRLTEIQGLNWAELLEYPGKTYVINDAKAAFIFELQDAALRDVENIMMLTLGTGVGGAMKVDGHILEGAIGRAGHLGNISVDADGPLALTGIPGGLDNLVGNCQLAERTHGLYTDYIALERDYVAQNPIATEYWLRMIKHLAVGIAGLVNVLDPEIVIIGGGIANAGKNLFNPLQSYLDLYEWRPYGKGVKIIRARGGDFSGAIGTALFVSKKIGSKFFTV